MMAKVSALLREQTGTVPGTVRGLSGNAVREQVRGRPTTALAALEMLVNEGYARVEKAGNAKLYSHVKPYEV